MAVPFCSLDIGGTQSGRRMDANPNESETLRSQDRQHGGRGVSLRGELAQREQMAPPQDPTPKITSLREDIVAAEVGSHGEARLDGVAPAHRKAVLNRVAACTLQGSITRA